MISYQETQTILKNQPRLAPHRVKIENACGLIAAQDVVSQVFVPSFLNAAMDGFAVKTTDLLSASRTNALNLSVTGSSMAGEVSIKGKGGAWEIMTGAYVPEGYDAVIKVEDVTVVKKHPNGRPAEIRISQSLAKKENIRSEGEDFKPNKQILKKGQLITPSSIMALSAVGESEILVTSQPNVIVMSSGKEVVDELDKELLPGQIRDANGPFLMAMLKECNCNAKYAGLIKDDPEEFEARVAATLNNTDIIISTGAVSAGCFDFIPTSLQRLGADIIFHKAAIRPGKPILYARFANGTHFFGLPGNPISAVIGFRFFILPLLYHLQGHPVEQPLKAKLKTSCSKPHNLRFFAKAKLTNTDNADLIVDILQGQESFKTHSLLGANCWAVLKEQQKDRQEGEIVDVYPVMPGGLRF